MDGQVIGRDGGRGDATFNDAGSYSYDDTTSKNDDSGSCFFDPPIENYRFIEVDNMNTGFRVVATRRNELVSKSDNTPFAGLSAAADGRDTGLPLL